MRSSGASGAGANGFGASDGQQFWRLRRPQETAFGRLKSAFHTPITLAVATTAFVAAGLFVGYDATTTIVGFNHTGAQAGDSRTANGANEPDEIAADRAEVLAEFPDLIEASLVSDALAERALATASPETAQDLLSAAESEGGALAGVAGRGGAAFALAGIFTALTLRRRRNGAMPDPVQRHNYATLASAIPMGVACWTAEGTMIVCNTNYRARLKLDDDQMTYPEALRTLLAGGYMKLVREDDQNRLLELHQQDGSCLLIDERPLQDGGFMTLVSDVTERKRTDVLLSTIREEQRQLARRYHEEKIRAEAASRAKTNFLAHLSHDIRTPLNHIIGFAELMQQETYGELGDPRYAEYVHSIKSSGEHLLNTFAAILDLAELENGQKVLRSDTVPVDEVIDSVSRRFRGQVNRAGIDLVVTADCGAVLRGDRLALVRMVGNIVENAIRFTPPGGRLTLATFAADDGVVIEITDTGIGMSQERLSGLSQPFALGDATFTRDGIGPGLGISISRAIAELSGGRMVIDSTPSIGTTVAISLPTESNLPGIVAAE
ncbi:hypothetical protein VW35_03875 [Devosia soli]|uniref:histidine kinase n=1 Tax=Devosia soli TaxID=361041 RepID=A0A0F5LFU2_9HYPH|nr:PAS domain-containing sensor histidine kinase [Devosia soli]KKB81266.1 hypothetical protein VW35_03875 [Devosia soli]